MPGRELSIYGHTRKGAHVALTKDEYAQLTHDFIANMGFNVKEVMPHVVIEAPMPETGTWPSSICRVTTLLLRTLRTPLPTMALPAPF